MTQLPALLDERLSSLFTAKELSQLQETFTLEKRPVSLRVNEVTSTLWEIHAALKTSDIWYRELSFPQGSFVLDAKHNESDIWKLDIYKQGKIYLQGLASQIPAHLFTHQSPKNILDACAAPWWKASQLMALYPEANVFACEPSKIRFEKMQHNFKKLWCSNVTLIHDRVENINSHIPKDTVFDIILVDAPCSGEWSILYNHTKFLDSWDITHIKKNYNRQKRIIDSVMPLLWDGWELIYSTCTLAPEENEAVLHYALCKFPEIHMKKIDIPADTSIQTLSPLTTFWKHSYKKEISENAVRIFPNEYSEGFFIAKITRNTSSKTPASS